MMHHDQDHSPEEHGMVLNRPLRPYLQPRHLSALSRRRFLRGAGVLMALPFLDTLPGQGAESKSVGTDGNPTSSRPYPQRLAILFTGNGISPQHWWAKGSGAEMELSKTLEPLNPFRKKLNVIDGLFNRPAVGVGIHPGQTGNLLSGMPLMKGAVLRGGISIDQVLANRIGQETVQPSLVLGCEQPISGYHETNFSMAYSSHISWQSEESPVPMEVYPSLAFDSLFENRGSKRMQSVIDRVKEDAARISRKISSEDNRKLDEYLTSVREVEKRVDKMRSEQAKAEEKAKDKSQPIFTMNRPDNGLPEDIREHMKLMCDIVAIALQTDKSRLATLVLCRDMSGLIFPFLNSRKAHHAASHDDLSDEYERICRYFVGQVAYLAAKLDAMPEGEGTVLDNTCLLYLSNMYSGSRHDNTKLPIVTLGSFGGTLQTGRVLDYTNKGDENRKLCSLYLSLMDKAGVNLPRFGDAAVRLADI
jgi:hypothetical protein